VASEVLILFSCMDEVLAIEFLKAELLKAAARKREQTARPKPNRLIKSGSKTETAKSRGENNSR